MSMTSATANLSNGPVAPRKALFLDRDGVINVDHGYVHRTDQVEFCAGIFDVVQRARGLGYAVVVVTNQAGIGRNLYTEADFERLSAWMSAEFAGRGAPIDRFYHCPFHPEHGVGEYRRDSPLRKPNPGMLLLAAEELNLALADSVMVGDKGSDILAGQRAGVARTIRVGRPGARDDIAAQADIVVDAVSDIAQYL